MKNDVEWVKEGRSDDLTILLVRMIGSPLRSGRLLGSRTLEGFGAGITVRKKDVAFRMANGQVG